MSWHDKYEKKIQIFYIIFCWIIFFGLSGLIIKYILYGRGAKNKQNADVFILRGRGHFAGMQMVADSRGVGVKNVVIRPIGVGTLGQVPLLNFLSNRENKQPNAVFR